MSRTHYSHSRGGPAIRFRGRKRIVRQKFSKRQIIHVLLVLVLMAVVLAVGMYLGWWSAMEEEMEEKKETERPAALLSRGHGSIGEKYANAQGFII
jgi:hypothetical protein